MALTREPHNRCGADTIAGWSGNGRSSGFQVRVDAQPLTPEQELLLILAGRRTWTLHTVADELHPRPARVIRQRPAGSTPRQTVHPDHVCTPPPGRTRA